MELALRKAILQILAGSVLIGVLAGPVSGSVLDVRVTESMSLTDEFDGVSDSEGSPTGSGEVNITNTLESTALYDLFLKFNTGPGTSLWAVSSPASGVSLDTTSESGYALVNIKELGAGASVILNYTCPGTRRIDFQESYSSEKILIGGSTAITLNLSNSAGKDISGVRLVGTAADNDSDSTDDFTFSDASTDSGTVSVLANTLSWEAGTISSGETASLDFTASESDEDAHSGVGLQSSMEHYLYNATLEFTIDDGSTSGSGVTLSEAPTGTTANFEISLQKNQLESGEGVSGGDDWGFTPTIENTDTETISFDISSVNVYVTTGSALDDTSAINSTQYTNVVLTDKSWTPAEWKIFNFPEPVPVGWVDVDLSADFSEGGGQLSETYLTVNGSYEIINTIYIINGYLVEAKKSIEKNGTGDLYDITLRVHNKGNLETPPLVYVYDIVPGDFEKKAWGTAPAGSTGVTSPLTGTAYWWQVGPLEADDSIDGSGLDEATIEYTVEGSGTYSLTELFILGIDPSYSLNMQSTPILKNGVSFVSHSGEWPAISLLMTVSMLVGIIGRSRKGQKGSGK